MGKARQLTAYAPLLMAVLCSQLSLAQTSDPIGYAREMITDRRYDVAISTLEEVASRFDHPRSMKDLQDTVNFHYLLALAYKFRGRFDKAAVEINIALRLAPTSFAVRQVAAEISEGLGQPALSLSSRGTARAQNNGIATSNLQQSAMTRSQSVVDIGIWEDQRLPIRVYLDDGTGTTGYQPQYRQNAIAAFKTWEADSHGMLTIQILEKSALEKRDARKDYASGIDPKRDIHVHWLPVLAFKDKEPLGVTYPMVVNINQVPRIICCDIYLSTNERGDGHPYTSETSGTYKTEQEEHERLLKFITVHEVGHALGLGHSPRRSDIMSPVVFGGISRDFYGEPTPTTSDVSHISTLYETDRRLAAKTGTTSKSPPADIVIGQYASGDYQGAANTSISVLKTSPENTSLIYLLGNCLVKLNKLDDAKVQYEKVLRLSPSGETHEYAKAALQKLNSSTTK